MEYFTILVSIIMINLLLSGDNALVIALACCNLNKKEQKKVIFWGSAGAIILRVLLTFIAVFLLRIPFLQFAGGVLLLWIALNLARGEEHHTEIVTGQGMLTAIKTIIVADLVMSVDNVIAIVGVAKGNIPLLIIGLATSIPIIIWGSTLIVKVMKKWPIIVIIGAGFLGWTAGEMMLGDAKVKIILEPYAWSEWLIPAACAILVVVLGQLLSRGQKTKQTNE